MATDDTDTYLAARIREALVQHPDLSGLTVEVTLAGDKVFLSGPVQTAERRDLVGDVASDASGGREIVNETWVVELGEPTEPEELS